MQASLMTDHAHHQAERGRIHQDIGHELPESSGDQTAVGGETEPGQDTLEGTRVAEDRPDHHGDGMDDDQERREEHREIADVEQRCPLGRWRDSKHGNGCWELPPQAGRALC